jgi:hypothetical protein
MVRSGASWRRAGLHGLVVVAVFVVGIGLIGLAGMWWLLNGSSGPWSDDPGRQLADRIRVADSPLVREVIFRPQTMIDPPEVHVIVNAGVTEAQAERLWCEVVAPAGGSQFEGDLGALIYDDAGNWLAANAQCGSPGPS